MPPAGSNLLAELERLSLPVATWLLTYAVHSTLLLGTVWLVCRLARLRSNALMDLLWKVGITAGIVTATLSVVSGISFTGRIDMPGGGVHSAGVAPAPISVRQLPGGNDSLEAGNAGGIAGPNGQGTSPAAGGSSGDLPGGATTPSSAPGQSPQGARGTDVEGDGSPASLLSAAGSLLLSRWNDALIGAWLLSAAVAALRAIAGKRRLAGYLGKRRVVSDGPLVEETAALCRLAGVRRHIKITCSVTLSSPVSVANSEICLPERVATGLSRDQQRSILAHELAHLVRHDPIWLTALAIIEVPLCFQPLNRVARRRMQEIAEYLCDDWAVRQTGSALNLAHCLVEVATWVRGSRQPGSVPGMAGGPSSSQSPLLRRVQRLLDAHTPLREEKVRPAWVFAALVVPLLVNCAAPIIAVRPPAAVSAGPAQSQPAGALQAPAPVDKGKVIAGYLDIKSEGQVRFTPDRTDVLSVSQSGLFSIEESDGVSVRKLEVAPLTDGSLTHLYYVNNRVQPYDASVRAWLAQSISTLRPMQRMPASDPATDLFADLSPNSLLPDPGQALHATSAASSMDRSTPGGGGHIEGRARGSVTFADDLASITSISDGGSLVIEEKQGAVTRRLQAIPGAGGKPALSYSIGGQPKPYDIAAQDWLAEILPDVAPTLVCHTTQPAPPSLKGQ